MWIKVILFAAFFVLGNAFTLENGIEVPRSLELLLDELKDRETRGQQLEECEGKPADIAFIIDSSRSIYGPDFVEGIRFLKSFADIFTIGPDNVRIAATAFGNVMITKNAFPFTKYNNKADTIAAIGRIVMDPYKGDGTDTGLALDYARRYFFSYARPNVKKIAIVLTDGRSTYPRRTKAASDALKSGDVEIIVIGVGSRIYEKELHEIASSPEGVFKVSSYGALKNIIRTLGFITCKVTTTAGPTTVPTTTPTTTTTTTTTTPPPKEEPCDGQEIDFNFVFDPAQMGMTGTENAIRFIKTVVSNDDLNNGKVRVGTITGPCPDTKGFRLNRYRDLPAISQHFDSYQRTDMASLITDLRQEAFDKKNGGRVAARKVAVVFLKGKLNDPERTVSEAKMAKAKGIEIFVVNAGSLNHESILESIASGKKDHILRAADSSEMIEMARSLVNNICKKKSVPDC